ncbi:MAG TPA: FMN-binding glutamate synthase family protein, partial [Bacteroidetes bacterium]|nr:FMN-binding glutamate synthase family protein [Bacteroidota bacterium]
QSAILPEVKMIELKLSQGAKPGHGGILPAKKNTLEIAKIRGVEPGTDVLSPAYHSAFNTPVEMMQFIGKLRDLSGGKPVGFKLCVGQKSEFLSICKAMIKTGIKPDYIDVDGGEGGTGAAPIEFSNSVGMPMRDGLVFVYDALVGFDLKKDIKILTSGKIATAFDIFRALALGADACYAARAFMLSLGCIQSLECNLNICPTGVATQRPDLMTGLVVKHKKDRVASFHRQTIKAFVELLAATGLDHQDKIQRSHIHRNETWTVINRYDESYPYLTQGDLLAAPYPEGWEKHMEEASPDTF